MSVIVIGPCGSGGPGLRRRDGTPFAKAGKNGHDGIMQPDWRQMATAAQIPTPAPAPAPAGGVVLGIDPGLRRTGYALLCTRVGSENARVIEAGLIRLDPAQPLPMRLVDLQESLTALLQRHRPAALACEEVYAHYKHPRTAVLMAHARGVILLCAAAAGLEVLSVAATNVKKLLTGSGHASKRQIQFAVLTALQLPVLPEPHDVADALAIALCGIRLRQARRAVTSALAADSAV